MKPRICKKCGKQFNSPMQKRICYSCQRTAERLKKEERAKRKLERKLNSKKYQKREWKKLHKKAWKIFSYYIRNKDALNGCNSCYTCGKIERSEELEAGHFIHGKLDFDERNIKPQCTYCNKYLHGNLAIYGIKLSQELGDKGMKQLELDSNTISYSKDDLENIIKKYKT